MFKINTTIQGLDKLQERINEIEKLIRIQNNQNKDFEKYIQDKVLEVVIQVSYQRLPGGSTSQEYIKNHKIRLVDGGFEVYNDTTISTDSDGYGGKFSIAMAFEYGTGLVGQENPKPNAWEYNVKGHTKGWVYFNEKTNSFGTTRGLHAFEIYRFAKEEIIKQMPQWIKEYKNRKEV